MLLLFSIRIALVKSCSVDLLCVSFVYVCQLVCLLLSFLVLRVGCGI